MHSFRFLILLVSFCHILAISQPGNLEDIGQELKEQANQLGKEIENDPEGFKTAFALIPDDRKEKMIVGASGVCHVTPVRIMLEVMNGKMDPATGTLALLLTINNCSDHPNGPRIINHLAEAGVNLNRKEYGYRPLMQAAAIAQETCQLKVLSAMLKNGADPEKLNLTNSGSISTLDAISVHADHSARGQCCKQVKEMLARAKQATSNPKTKSKKTSTGDGLLSKLFKNL